MRSIYCGQVTSSHVDQTVTLCGWVHRRRDLGGLIFIDMRDREGIIQVFFDPDQPEAFHWHQNCVMNSVFVSLVQYALAQKARSIKTWRLAKSKCSRMV